jgi:hypothetical protein
MWKTKAVVFSGSESDTIQTITYPVALSEGFAQPFLVRDRSLGDNQLFDITLLLGASYGSSITVYPYNRRSGAGYWVNIKIIGYK